jgi:hypothetical protein
MKIFTPFAAIFSFLIFTPVHAQTITVVDIIAHPALDGVAIPGIGVNLKTDDSLLPCVDGIGVQASVNVLPRYRVRFENDPYADDQSTIVVEEVQVLQSNNLPKPYEVIEPIGGLGDDSFYSKCGDGFVTEVHLGEQVAYRYSVRKTDLLASGLTAYAIDTTDVKLASASFTKVLSALANEKISSYAPTFTSDPEVDGYQPDQLYPTTAQALQSFTKVLALAKDADMLSTIEIVVESYPVSAPAMVSLGLHK